MKVVKSQRPVSGKTVDPVSLIRQICDQPGGRGYLRRLRINLKRAGLYSAVASHDSQALYDWLMGCFSYQGVSDAIALTYIEKHGNATYQVLQSQLSSAESLCPKLSNFESFQDCGYRKLDQTCSRPKLIKACPLPRLPLRKGQLNQAAYSLFLFIRERCGGDLVGFIDRSLAEADRPGHPDRLALMREALTGQLLAVVGISQKLINMSFADLLMGADRKRSRWIEVGTSMVAVDSLVHNFLCRTGIHYWYETDHKFGQACYGRQGCAGILDDLARQIDCSVYDPAYPIYFPRFIQHSIWRFCAEAEQGICNGRSIDDRDRCGNTACPIFSECGRVALNPA